MKPYQLIAALMAQQGLGPMPLAKKMGKPALQPQIHRFRRGEVRHPEVTTAAPLAEYFKIPLEAIYEEKAATAVARARGISEVPDIRPPTVRKKAPKEAPFDKDVMKFAAQYAKMSPAERQRLRLLMLAARDGVDPSNIARAPGRDSSEPADPWLGGISNLSELDETPSRQDQKKGPRR